MKKIILVLIFAAIVSLPLFSLADAPGPPSPAGQGGGGGGGDPVGAPIDGGLGILLAMGAAYGSKKLYKARKDKKEAEAKAEEATEA
ncbi:MAG: hypothetical protein WCI92_18810 [Bacteroidota bacterium]